MQITIKITGDKDVFARLEKLGDKLLSMQPEMTEIGGELKKYFAGPVFASQGGVLGHKWAGLSLAYKNRKAKGNTRKQPLGKGAYPGRGVLVRTGKMQDSFRMYATKNSVTIDNSAPYFKYHQSTDPRHKIPYRPMMAFNNATKSMIGQVIEDGVRRKINEVRL